jgi:hypothetical protein
LEELVKQPKQQPRVGKKPHRRVLESTIRGKRMTAEIGPTTVRLREMGRHYCVELNWNQVYILGTQYGRLINTDPRQHSVEP